MPIKYFLNKVIGLEATVRMLKSGRYIVVLYDIDEQHYLPSLAAPFLSRDVAIKYAEEVLA